MSRWSWDAEQNAELDAVNIMTLHSARASNSNGVPARLEEGLFPHQRALDEGAAAPSRKSGASPMSE